MVNVPIGTGPAIFIEYTSSQLVFNDPTTGHTTGCGRNDCGYLDIQTTYIGDGTYTWINKGAGTSGYITMTDNNHFIYSLIVGSQQRDGRYQLNMIGGSGKLLFANATYFRVE
jgi:hypothetical protein